MAIMIAGGCNTTDEENAKKEGTEDTKSEGSSFDLIESNVTIYLKDTLIDGRKHLLMYDSKDIKIKVIDTLTTDVQPGDDILWKTVKGSDIHHIEVVKGINAKYYQLAYENFKLSTSILLHLYPG